MIALSASALTISTLHLSMSSSSQESSKLWTKIASFHLFKSKPQLGFNFITVTARTLFFKLTWFSSFAWLWKPHFFLHNKFGKPFFSKVHSSELSYTPREIKCHHSPGVIFSSRWLYFSVVCLYRNKHYTKAATSAPIQTSCSNPSWDKKQIMYLFDLWWLFSEYYSLCCHC